MSIGDVVVIGSLVGFLVGLFYILNDFEKKNGRLWP
jgi:hypothetical protein